ncbi:glycosyltransferase family 39 protein [Candidatus Gottesmanbacteria bacterium]|nr:glycosyltransferase family 39 protein [Candidatus Gottesmanbacteria bacterium]
MVGTFFPFWERLRLRWRETALLLIAFLVFSLSFYSFTTNPPTWFDEGVLFQVVKNIANDGTHGAQLTPGTFSDISLISVGYPALYPAALAVRLFGADIGVLRLVAIGYLLGFILVFFLLARRLFGIDSAIFSTLLLGTFAPVYGNGKNFLGEVPGLFYFAVALLLLSVVERAHEERRRQIFIALLSGVGFGLAMSTKPSFLIIGPSMALATLIFWRRISGELKKPAMVGAVFIGTLLSLAAWIVTQFGISDSFQRIFTHYSNPYYVTDFLPLVITNILRFFTEITPMHFLVLFLVAVAFLVERCRERAHIFLSEGIVLFFAVFTVIFYVRTAGWYRYFFPAHVLLFLFLPVGLAFFFDKAKNIFKFPDKRILLLLFLFIGGIQIIPLWQWISQNANDPMTELAPYLDDLSARNVAPFFYNIPAIASRFTGTEFFQYIKMSDQLILGKENEALLRQGVFTTVLVSTDAADEIKNVPNCYFLRQQVGKLLFFERDLRRSCVLPDARKS